MSLKKPLIVMRYSGSVTKKMLAELNDCKKEMSNSLGVDVLLAPDTVDISIHDNSLHESINNMAQRITELIESNDRLTKALIESYSESEPDYDVDIPQPVYMDGSEVK